jgi:HD-GYP domain-containing protein (c-di-GMP phosphodiesterase class II)
MRKKIPISKLRVGMAVAEIPGPWLDHGLWRTRFVVRDAAELAAIQASDVAEVVIDTRLGLDVVEAPVDGSQESGDPSAKPLADDSQPASHVALSLPLKLRHSPGESWAEAQALVADAFERMRSSRSIDLGAVRAAVDDIMCALERDRFAMMGLALLKGCDTYTFAHSVSVCALMVAFGQHLQLDNEHCRALGTAGLFHDIGKAALSNALVLKPGPLTDDEFRQVKEHPALGADYLGQFRQNCPVAIDVCLHHHERFDGSGYLGGKKGEEVSMESRMAAICDVYDAITSRRPYKEAWDPAVALGRMESWSGHFDSRLLASFVSMLSPYPTGTLVRLASGRIGVVVRPSPHTPLKAVVRVFYNATNQTHITPRLVDLAKEDDQIQALEPTGAWATPVLRSVQQEAFGMSVFSKGPRA